MLKDIRELGNDLRKYFLEINQWSELTFNSKDKENLLTIDHVIEVADHSMTFKIDANHSIVPSQYILYAVLMKEFAIGLRQHLDVFDRFKSGKSQNEIGEQISSGTFDLSNQSLDIWSKKIALKPLTDKEYNFDAKSIINGHSGNFKIRGTSDFFSSVILKVINVPDASSAILGKLIYSLSGKPDLYNYLEKRFYKKLQFLIKESRANSFAYKVFSFLLQYDNLEKLKSSIKSNADRNFKSIKSGEYSLTSIFKISKDLQSVEDLSMGNKPRFFTSPIYLDKETEELNYFSTEWTYGTNSRLDIESLISILKIHYPEFSIVNDNSKFILKAIGAPSSLKEISNFKLSKLTDSLAESGLSFNHQFIARFVASLLTKPFVLLTGLSGSGKTKIAQSFARWICEDKDQYKIIPVGSDWTNREPLLGYPNGLDPKEYILPDCGALRLIIEASKEENQQKPYFLILDEMNLSHVERYFADFLSVMESDEEIMLYSGEQRKSSDGIEIPNSISWPRNLFVIGTVNIDETTYMFSPKVLDRANTIEFRINDNNIEGFLKQPSKIDLSVLDGKGASMAQHFLALSWDNQIEPNGIYTETFVKFFNELKKIGAEFGYRTAFEMLLLIKKLNTVGEFSKEESIDIALMQKLLPKLHGSRSKISKVLDALIILCLKQGVAFSIAKSDEVKTEEILYPIAFDKLVRMYKNALNNGFTSYTEA